MPILLSSDEPQRYLRSFERIVERIPLLKRVVDYLSPPSTPPELFGETFTKRSIVLLTVIMTSSVFLGAVTPWLDIGWAFGEGDLMTWISFFLLCTISYLGHKVWYLRNAGAPFSWNQDAALWRILGYGFLFLAFDELLRIHETLDRVLHRIVGVKPTDMTDHLDDLIIGLYGLVGAICLLRYFRELVPFLKSWKYIAFAALSTILTVVLDFGASAKHIWRKVFDEPKTVQLTIDILDVVEEFFKLYAEVFFVGAFISVLTMLKRPPTLIESDSGISSSRHVRDA